MMGMKRASSYVYKQQGAKIGLVLTSNPTVHGSTLGDIVQHLLWEKFNLLRTVIKLSERVQR